MKVKALRDGTPLTIFTKLIDSYSAKLIDGASLPLAISNTNAKQTQSKAKNQTELN